jgi:hypothetical protein
MSNKHNFLSKVEFFLTKVCAKHFLIFNFKQLLKDVKESL